MADDSKVIVTLRLVGGATFDAAAKAASRELAAVGAGGKAAAAGIAATGDAGIVASGKLGRARSAAGMLGGAMRGIGKGAVVGAAAVSVATLGFVDFTKHALEKVKSLGETASVLTNIAGMSGNAGIQLAAVAQATGVQARPLGMALKALGTQATNAAKGSKASVDTFKALGISMDQVKGTGGDMTKLLALVADGLEKTHGGAGKVAAASKLLGRGWMSLNPLLEGGGREMRSLTRFAGGLGITLDKNTAKNMAKARDASFRWKLVIMALQLFVVNKLLPAILQIATWLNQHVIPAFKWFATAVENTINFVAPKIRSLIGAARETVQWVTNAFNNMVSFFDKLPGRISRSASGMWNGIKSGLMDVLNWIITQWNNLPFIHGFDLGPLHVPGLPTVTPLGQGASAPAANPLMPKTPAANPLGGNPLTVPKSTALGGGRPTSNLAVSAPMFANVILNLDSQVLHRGVYRVERARAEG